MSLPISWVVAGAIPASQALKQTVNLASTSASHFFGELLQTSPTLSSPLSADSGHSAQNAAAPKSKTSSDPNNVANRIESIRSYLSKFVDDARSRYGIASGTTKSDGISISANGKDSPVLRGPEPMRTELENHLRDHPSLEREINAIALQKSSSDPLQMLPLNSAKAPTDDPWTLWLEPQ